VLNVVPVEGSLLERVLEATYATSHDGLTRPAFARLEAARQQTVWGARYQHRFALIKGTEILASAQQYDLVGTLDNRRVNICGIAGMWSHPTHDDGEPARTLASRLIDRATENGCDLALFFSSDGTASPPDGCEVVPTMNVELTVIESVRHGAPMTMVRSGEDRDLAAIAAMGEARARAVRFHLDRDVDFVKHAITSKRLLAGLGLTGARQLQFLIAEEGITAAAYIVISCVGQAWTIEECGDRDPSGARVGALLQALVAREPAERRPLIRGWLPPDFAPPQIAVTTSTPSRQVLWGKILAPAEKALQLSRGEVVYWRGDFF
jgi:hypothetical protein